jgi:anti-anti-sigma factor
MEALTFTLCGEYDVANADDLAADLLRFARSSGVGPVTVDCGHLRFIDSSGIAALLRVRDTLARDRRALRLVSVPPTARRVIEILGLHDTLGVVNGS